jgi:hypothetical protein
MPLSPCSLLSLGALTLGLTLGAFAETPLDGESPPNSEPQYVEITPTPEPNTMILAGLGGLALLVFAIRRK